MASRKQTQQSQRLIDMSLSGEEEDFDEMEMESNTESDYDEDESDEEMADEPASVVTKRRRNPAKKSPTTPRGKSTPAPVSNTPTLPPSIVAAASMPDITVTPVVSSSAKKRYRKTNSEIANGKVEKKTKRSYVKKAKTSGAIIQDGGGDDGGEGGGACNMDEGEKEAQAVNGVNLIVDSETVHDYSNTGPVLCKDKFHLGGGFYVQVILFHTIITVIFNILLIHISFIPGWQTRGSTTSEVHLRRTCFFPHLARQTKGEAKFPF